MQITRIEAKNYRCLENCIINFPSYYSAISAKNNAGKSNVLRIIRALLAEEDPYDPFGGEVQPLTHKNDYPYWKQKDGVQECIEISMHIRIARDADAGLFRFITEFADIQPAEDNLTVAIYRRLEPKASIAILQIGIDDALIEDDFRAQEVYKKIRSASAFYFHNSTKPRHRYYARTGFNSLFQNISTDDREKIQADKARLFNRLKTVAKKHKEDISTLLGRLEEKYDVSISIPTFEIEHFPFDIALGAKGVDIALDDWGSGTQNRTMILLAILQAKKVSEAASESDRVAPIIVVEEPESFLHPSAQAEFGRVLRDLAHEFKVQVITTTHSPYFLSVKRPESNILIDRKASRNEVKESIVVDTEGTDWKEPFALALGINNDALNQWRDVLFQDTGELLLVEGEIDREYFELLRDTRHGAKSLQFSGEIFAYGGDGFFSNTVLLKFILNRFSNVFITYDYDADSKVSRVLEGLGLKRGVDFLAIGRNESGKSDIEGLLPSRITGEVYAANTDLADKAIGRGSDSNDARQKLKRLKLEHFKISASIENGEFDEFYRIARAIERGMKTK